MKRCEIHELQKGLCYNHNKGMLLFTTIAEYISLVTMAGDIFRV